jgi:coenzyme F420-0:L-glutamate ligase / coenzyme F420-1:gamma-L-glutamate ligase
MPDLIDALKERRSVRKYQPKPVPKELILKILQAAGAAPSAHNSQSYRFIILEDARVKRELAEAMAKMWAADMEKDGQPMNADRRRERVDRFAKAPCLILACTTSVDGLPVYADERRSCVRDLAMQSLGAAIENLLLAAHALGLGGCWYAAPCFCKETVRIVLKIPHEVEPQAFVVLGYAAEKPSAPLKKAVGDFCFSDGWSRAFG